MSEVRLTKPVAARFFRDLPEDAPAGSFTLYSDRLHASAGMIYVCPCGCGQQGSLSFRMPGCQATSQWEWNGDQERATLSPSVHHVGHWHGWLRNGQWEQA